MSKPLTFTNLPLGATRGRRPRRWAWAVVVGAVVGAVSLSIGLGVYLWL